MLPKVITTSVIRSANQGQSHGGAYIVDLEAETVRQVLDWNDQSINWNGRGADRGLRGIALHNNRVYLAASDELFVYDPDFNKIGSYRNGYLKHCHEIYCSGSALFLASTGFDSVLMFNLDKQRFTIGFCLRYDQNHRRLTFTTFDPALQNGPKQGDSIHLNNIFFDKGFLFFGALRLDRLLYCDFQKRTISSYADIPRGTHNARPFRDGVVYNDTVSSMVVYCDRSGSVRESFDIITYPVDMLLNADLPRDYARQGFGRGLCLFNDQTLVAGSSPATLSVYRLDDSDCLKTINLSMDVRNSIHGLALWPY